MQRYDIPPSRPAVRRLIPGLCLFAACLGAPVAHAQSAPPKVEPSDDSVASKPAMVVQNRFFKKALRPEFSIFGGTILNEAYSRTVGGGVRLGLFINEYLGFDYSYVAFSASGSDDLKALNNLSYCETPACASKVKVTPSYVTLDSGHTGLISFVPVYGKINLLDMYILYSDIYLSAGAGVLSTSDGNKTPVVLGVGQRFYFAKSFNVRVDAWDHIYAETRTNQGKKLESTRNAWMVSVGASVFLWGSGD